MSPLCCGLAPLSRYKWLWGIVTSVAAMTLVLLLWKSQAFTNMNVSFFETMPVGPVLLFGHTFSPRAIDSGLGWATITFLYGGYLWSIPCHKASHRRHWSTTP